MQYNHHHFAGRKEPDILIGCTDAIGYNHRYVMRVVFQSGAETLAIMGWNDRCVQAK